MKAGWAEVPLEQVASIDYGTRVVKKRDAGTKFPVYGGGGATFFVDDFNREDQLIVSRFGMSEECARFVQGRFFLNDSGLTVSRRNDQEVDQRFLDYLMIGKQAAIYAMGRGTAQKNLNVETFRSLSVPLPPIEEQRRIVAVLDEAFEGLARARANVEANVADAERLQQRTIDQLFGSVRGDNRALEEIARLSYGLTASADHEIEGPRFLRITDIQHGSVNWDRVPSCVCDSVAVDKYGLTDGDIVFARTGATTGKSFLIEDAPTAVAASYLIRLRCTDPTVDPRYIAFYFNSGAYWLEVEAGTTGSAQGGFNASKLKALRLPIPALEEQQKLVTTLAEARNRAIKLASKNASKLADLDLLKASFLSRAFAGELT